MSEQAGTQPSADSGDEKKAVEPSTNPTTAGERRPALHESVAAMHKEAVSSDAKARRTQSLLHTIFGWLGVIIAGLVAAGFLAQGNVPGLPWVLSGVVAAAAAVGLVRKVVRWFKGKGHRKR
ncbi:hypothetical protein V5P93_006145 [Actinokineospora auranticolor]|uniref:Uncharacterized protein n=1 Tax=Actinokineospora auranticolor TaxID=155976 RepID=A0A2S6GGB6_9PSEU|nr:hypothetical protein [Actinokineospora auranticolor]PPK64235.1 hypothetical protein CLV40_12199 [Actinokineospora auranticolor]